MSSPCVEILDRVVSSSEGGGDGRHKGMDSGGDPEGMDPSSSMRFLLSFSLSDWDSSSLQSVPVNEG